MLSTPLTRRAGRQLVAVLASVLVLALAAACSSAHKPAAPPQPVVNAPVSTTATIAGAAGATAPSGPPDGAPLMEFRMHGAADANGKPFDVTGKVVVLGINPATNTMESPNNQNDVGYYDFTSHPGAPCQGADQCANTVVSGHVDWYAGGPAGGPSQGVFWNLRFMKDGDEIDLKLQDGRTYTYKVVANTVYSDENAPVQQIIGPTAQASVTLITCDGDFNQGEYNSRRIVRAVQTST